SGSQGLYHIKGVTPECKERVFDICERITVESCSLSEVKESLSEQCSPEYVCIGCPHCSIDEMEYISNIAVKGRFKKRLIIYTSRHVWSIAKRRGYLDRIINAGGRVVRDTCMVVSPIEKIGIGEVVTNSTKAAYYLSALSRVKTVLKSLGEALEYARNGN
ncbi:MAG: aconitase X, partial [Candidatus Bathyarchaeia archaeon]